MKKANLFLPIALALALTGCGSSDKANIASDYCLMPLTVQDTAHITHFKPGAGRDPRDIVFEADIGNASVACSVSKNQLEINMVVRVSVAAGPAVAEGQTRVPYFVRVIGPSGAVVQGQDFNADFKLSASNPRGASQEELTVRLPFQKPSDLGGYKIAIGLKPTMEELEYNRHSASR
jgi:hypothetical protein